MKKVKKVEAIQALKAAPRVIQQVITALLLLIFCVIGVLSFSTITNMQGNARVVNYTGIVRGATQRLVKQELAGRPNDALILRLEELIDGLILGSNELNLIELPDKEYQDLLKELDSNWNQLKQEISQVRNGGEKDRLFELSESYFDLADRTVSAAEYYSERCVANAKSTLICLNAGFVLFGILFLLYGRWQKKTQAALDTANRASQAKSEFLSSMSHEIRTPMNGIVGMTAIARLSLDDRDKLLDCLDKIDLSSSYLLALINNVLDMSRIESGKIQLENEEFHIVDVLDRLAVMFQPKAENSCIQFSVHYEGLEGLMVVGDELRLSQILVNIVSNALKFTPAGGQVRLTAQEIAADEDTSSLEFSVADTGIGISEEFQAHLFEAFEQEQAATSRQYGGTGLGLAISYRFTQMMGGEITVNSQLGKGSTFIVRFTLPRAESGTAVERKGGLFFAEGEQAAIQSLEGLRILLAEDNAINSEIVSGILESQGARVDSVFNGKEAVEKFEASEPGHYQFVLMDIQMPAMDGLEASRKIRACQRPDAKSIPIIGISANAFQEDRTRALESGMNGYLTKPIDTQKLMDTLCSSMLADPSTSQV